MHAKSDAEIIAVRPLLGRANLTLLTNAEVTRLETDDSGRTITGVVVSRNGDREVYQGDIVAISAGAANSAKILLNSATDRHWFAPEWGLSDAAKHSVDWWLTTELLPQHRRGEPRSDGNGQRAAGRRPHPEPPDVVGIRRLRCFTSGW